MANGWIRVSRDLLDVRHDLHPQATGDPACRMGAWIDMIGYARWEDGGGLKRGELLAGERFLASRWNWSRGRVRRFLDSLEAHGRIQRHDTPGPRQPARISICNYDSYQTPRPTSEPTNGTANRPTNGTKEEQEQQQQQQLTTSAAVGIFLEQTGADWRLNTSISEWCEEIEAEKKYAGADIPYEIRKAADWYDSHGKKPKAPDMSIRNWLEKAGKDARSEQKRGTTPDALRRPRVIQGEYQWGSE